MENKEKEYIPSMPVKLSRKHLQVSGSSKDRFPEFVYPEHFQYKIFLRGYKGPVRPEPYGYYKQYDLTDHNYKTDAIYSIFRLGIPPNGTSLPLEKLLRELCLPSLLVDIFDFDLDKVLELDPRRPQYLINLVPSQNESYLDHLDYLTQVVYRAKVTRKLIKTEASDIDSPKYKDNGTSLGLLLTAFHLIESFVVFAREHELNFAVERTS